MAFSMKECYDISETDSDCNDDSQEDPIFDVFEETLLTLSDLSLKRVSKTRMTGETDEKEDEGKLDEQDQKSFETIQKIIEGGHLDRLKVDQCKLYLRKYGLRLSGNKDTLIQRIKEHIDIVSGGGEKKYPASSFVMNCKGDACTGDVVMFEQNVYEEFSIASRSSKGGSCGTRVVAGRILKESYGAAKQQHTFTIEVLWSKGEKPLPPLHPLLIKGRNLYRLNTMRQRWEDEGERQKFLLEKHTRGGAARLRRKARIQHKEMQEPLKQIRTPKCARQEEENRAPQPPPVYVKPEIPINQPIQVQQQQKVQCCTTTCEPYIPAWPVNLHRQSNHTSNAHVPPVHQRQPFNSNLFSSNIPTRVSYNEQHENYHTARSPIRRHPLSIFPDSNHFTMPVQQTIFKEQQGCSSMRIPLRGFGHENVLLPYSQQSQAPNWNAAARNAPVVQQKGNEEKQKCRHFLQGRCYYGDRCKYSHALAEYR